MRRFVESELGQQVVEQAVMVAASRALKALKARHHVLASDARGAGQRVADGLKGGRKVVALVIKRVVEVEGDDLDGRRSERDQAGNRKYSW
jgi:hypothetical protein